MNLKSLFYAAVAIVAISMISCSKKQAEATECKAITVDSVFASADELVGDTIEVKGLCSHLCSHGATKAFLLGEDTSLLLRCQATPEMGGAFALDSKGKCLVVKGIVRENRIDSAAVAAMEEHYAAADTAGKAHEACDTEKKAQGQDSINTFEARMADYRAKIADRNAKEGKAYLSFYYLETISYAADSCCTAE